MPLKLRTVCTEDLNTAATDEDHTLLIRAYTLPPGIRGMLRIPSDPVYKLTILFINLFTFSCAIIDFTIALGASSPIRMLPMRNGTLRHVLFCFDFIYLIEVLLSICQRKAHIPHARHAVIVILDCISLIPYEMVYIVLKGRNIRVFYALRLRYVLRLFRYMSKARNAFKLSLMYVMSVYAVILGGVCILAVCIRLHLMCHHPGAEDFKIIQCDNFTAFDFLLTYAIINGQLSYSAMIFVDDPYAIIQPMDSFLQIIHFFTLYVLIPKIVCIILERQHNKYMFCLTGHQVFKNITSAKRMWLLRPEPDDDTADRKRFLAFVNMYMTSYWRYYDIENMQNSYVGNYRVATVPSVIYSEITLDITWNMLKHSQLFRNECTAFLRQLAKLTVFTFGAKNDIIYEQGELRCEMIYIIKGIVSLMSESTGRTPLVSFTSGTCFGELTLFLNLPATTTVFCSTYVEYIQLTRANFIRVRRYYPKVYARLRKTCLRRIAIARNYDFIARDIYANGESPWCKSQVSMRYIKAMIREYLGAPGVPLEKSMFMPETVAFENTIFNTQYLMQYVMADEMVSKMSTNFSVSGWNFKLKPASTLIVIWSDVVCFLSLVDNILYPLGAAQDTPLFTNFYDYFVMVVNICYILDFMSFNYIAIKLDGKLIVDSQTILYRKIQSAAFWLDFAACVPLEVIIHLMQGPCHQDVYRMLGINRLLKTFKVLDKVNNKLIFSPARLILFQFAKAAYGMIMLLVFGYLVFHRFGYFQLCNLQAATFWLKLAVVYQFYTSMSVVGMRLNRDVHLLPMIVMQTVAFVFLTYILCLTAACFSLIYVPTVEYENLIEDTQRVFELYQFADAPRKRITKYMRLNFNSGKRNLQMRGGERAVAKKMLGTSLFRMHRERAYYEFVARLRLCALMNTSVVLGLCEIGQVVLIPHGETIITAGSIVKNVYFIMGGRCEYVNRMGESPYKHSERGDALLLLEAIVGLDALNNIVAVTDCQLLAVAVGEFRHILVQHPKEMELIASAFAGVIANTQLTQLQDSPPQVFAAFEDGDSCRYFDNKVFKYKEVFGYFRFLNILFMRQSITPFGRFWLSWEIAQVTVAYVYSLVGTIPITITCDTHDVWFWFFRSMDAFFLLDIYLRHHVIHFNELNVEVQHPWRCSLHYWRTSFCIDLLGSIPLELIVLPLRQNITARMLSLLRLNRYLRLYRFLGVYKFLNYRYMKTHKIQIIVPYLAVSILLFNFFIVELLLSDGNVPVVDGTPYFNFGNSKQFWREYMAHLHTALRQLCNIGIFEGFRGDADLWKDVLMNAVGLLIITSLTCVLIAMNLFRRTYLMTFQIKMQRLVFFMNIRKIDKALRNELIKHFEYLWSLREGKLNINEALQQFSMNSTEEVVYSHYAPVLQLTLLFVDFPRVILKDLLASPVMRRTLVLLSGVVLRVNDIRGNIYILYKGTVEVLGPDYSYLRDLRIGSLFGCLDNARLHRSTLTYVAKTHCEFLCLPSEEFHEILGMYPRQYHYYNQLLRSSNYDYIPCQQMKKFTRARNVTVSAPNAERGGGGCGRAIALLKRMFPVLKHNERLQLAFIVFMVIAFHYECMLCTFLYQHFYASVYIAYLFDAVVWLKIYIDCSTAYEDQNGLMVTSRRLIALRYMRAYTGFIFHVLANLPLELIVFVIPVRLIDVHQCWAYLRANRLVKIILVFNYIRSVRSRLNINVRLIRSIDLIMVIFVTQQLSTILLARYINEQHAYIDSLVFHSYFISKKLHTPFNLTVPEFTKSISYQINYIIIMLITQVVCLIVLGDCVATYSMLNFSRFRYETFLLNQDNVMRLIGVSTPLFERVQSYCRNLINHGLNVQFPSFIIDAPYYLREGILDAMFGFHLRRHPVFKQCHMDFVRQVAATFKTSYFFEGDIIVYKDDIDTKMYFVHYGEIEGLVEDNLHYDVADSRYGAGDYFGFHQLIYYDTGHPRTYKVVSTKAMVLSLKRNRVLQLLDFFPASKFIFFESEAANDDLENANVEYRDYLKFTKGIHE